MERWGTVWAYTVRAETRQAVRSWRLFVAALAFGALLFLSATEAILMGIVRIMPL